MIKSPDRQGDVIITKAMVQAGLRELNDGGLLEYQTDSNSLVVRGILIKALEAGGVFCKIRAGVS